MRRGVDLREILHDPKLRRELLVRSIYVLRLRDDASMTMKRAEKAYDEAQTGGYRGKCETCNVEAQEGAEDSPHPMPWILHTCIEKNKG